MALTNRERIGKGLELLKEGLQDFVERELSTHLGAEWFEKVSAGLRFGLDKDKSGKAQWDNSALLTAMWDYWNVAFKDVLGRSHRTLVSELREVRNSWAHDKQFSTDDTYRALNSIRMLLEAVCSAEKAKEVGNIEQELLRSKFAEQSRQQTRQTSSVEGQPQQGLKAWRDIVTPHKDVSSGEYQRASFAADLDQVHQGEGPDEYRVASEFFRRTFITEGLKQLLTGALRRVTGKGGDPIVELQTNFGGGKTHSMLALYHLFSDKDGGIYAGVEPLLQELGLQKTPSARRAVLVGTALAPGQPQIKSDGTQVNTLWGELAWQLGGLEAYKMVSESDQTGTNPGSQVLIKLFKKYSPCVILIDEWIAYVRQLYGVQALSGGSFDANLTFAQSLTEAVKAVDDTLLVASLPASDIEIGGDGGKAALDRLKQTFGRVESTWRPATADEGFEIVRRRLFEPLIDPQKFAARDAVIKAFSDLYRTQTQEFPNGCGDFEYRRRLELAYPIHPDLFDRLYEDWSTLDKFQRTRGVLRLMAAVIHALWEKDDKNLLIMPCTVPVDDSQCQFEITRYLEDSWDGVIGKDVDGSHSLPLSMDNNIPTLGRYCAARRIARTIFIGSAPTAKASQPGIETKRINLGCVQPGESVATFGDALRRLSDQATYLYVDGQRYWYDTQQSVSRLAQDRAEQQDIHAVRDEIVRRLRLDVKTEKQRGDFAGVHVAPENSNEIPDEMEARLVILAPHQVHNKNAETSAARTAAIDFYTNRGSSRRIYQNTIVFLAPDSKKIAELEHVVRQQLAWASIASEAEALNLTAFATKQAVSKKEKADQAISILIPETWTLCLVPSQPDVASPMEWLEYRIQGDGTTAQRVSKKLVHEEQLWPVIGPARLLLDLDQYVWKDEPHISLKRLWECICTYIYLPRLRDKSVLIEAIRDGINKKIVGQHFGYAERFDDESKQYIGLRTFGDGPITIDSMSVLIPLKTAHEHEEAAAEAKRAAVASRSAALNTQGSPKEQAQNAGPSAANPSAAPSPVVAPPKINRFYGSVSLSPDRIGRDAGKIAEEVIQHLLLVPGSQVTVTMEIQVTLPDGLPDATQRAVTENCESLKFSSHGFESGS